jgi:hypothetical protein
VDKQTWTTILIVAVPATLLFSLASLARARPRWQVIPPFLASLAASVAIYASTVDGASSFHTAFVLCVLAALAISLVCIAVQPRWSRLATVSWSLLGVVTPYTVLIGLLAVACWGQTECLG